MIAPSYYSYKQYTEDLAIEQYLKEHNLVGLPLNKATAIRVSDQLRKDFNVDLPTFKRMSYKNRPFLREPSLELIEHKEGLCGEGSRLLVNLLNRLGYDATRVTLYNRQLHPSHTIVSAKVSDKEFFVDSINSTQQENDLIKKYDIGPSDFHIMKYMDELHQRINFIQTNKNRKHKADLQFFFDKYWLFSYEAKPYSKILNKLGYDMRVFNYSRPKKFISELAEKPYMILFYITMIPPVTIALVITWLLIRARNQDTQRKKNQDTQHLQPV
jgi:hypothetical protein